MSIQLGEPGGWVIVVATDRAGGGSARSVLRALGKVWRIAGVNPRLYLIDAEGAIELDSPEGPSSDGDGHRVPSFEAAQRCLPGWCGDPGSHLVLVDLSSESPGLHTGLLPWVALASESTCGDPIEPTCGVHEVVSRVLCGGSQLSVVTFTGAPHNSTLEQAWERIMVPLQHASHGEGA